MSDTGPVPDAEGEGASAPTAAATSAFEVGLFAALTLFLVLGGAAYYIWSDEWAGTVLLVLGGGLAAITGGFFYLQSRAESGDADRLHRPEPVEEPDPIHASIWPLEMGAGITITCLGLVLGRFVLLFGLVVLAHSVVGWITQSRTGH